jgi:aminopeptidase YwaD
VLGSISRQADRALGWWWHTPEDTLDKIDPVRLARDTGIALDVTERFLMDAVLPLDYAASAADIRMNLDGLAGVAGGRFDLSPAIREARRLEALCERLGAAARQTSDAATINACLRQLGRLLIPVTYTAAGRHAHDPALDVPFLPKLQGLRRLAALPAGSDAARFLTVDLTRARSELQSALRRACATVETCLGRLRPEHRRS